MPFAAGTFTLYAGNPVTTNTTISSSWANNTLSDIATGLTTCVLKDGTQTITANIPMAGFVFTGLGAGDANGESVRFQQVLQTQTLTDGATISWDGSAGAMATVTLGGNRTMAAPSNLTVGGLYRFVVTQDGTGGRTLTWNAVFKGQGGGVMAQPLTAASAVTAFTFVSDGTNLYDVSNMPFMDTNPVVRGATDPTKMIRFEVDGLTTATTRVITPLDENFTMVGVASTQTLTNKTLTSPTITGAGITTSTLTSPVIDTGVSGTAVATQANMETGTATDLIVTPGRQPFHPGHPKCWAMVTVSAGSPTLQSSYNITSITDTATGQLTITIATDFTDANWCCIPGMEVNNVYAADAHSINLYTLSINTGSLAQGSVLLEVGLLTTDIAGTLAGYVLADPSSWHMTGLGDQT